MLFDLPSSEMNVGLTRHMLANLFNVLECTQNPINYAQKYAKALLTI